MNIPFTISTVAIPYSHAGDAFIVVTTRGKVPAFRDYATVYLICLSYAGRAQGGGLMAAGRYGSTSQERRPPGRKDYPEQPPPPSLYSDGRCADSVRAATLLPSRLLTTYRTHLDGLAPWCCLLLTCRTHRAATNRCFARTRYALATPAQRMENILYRHPHGRTSRGALALRAVWRHVAQIWEKFCYAPGMTAEAFSQSFNANLLHDWCSSDHDCLSGRRLGIRWNITNPSVDDKVYMFEWVLMGDSDCPKTDPSARRARTLLNEDERTEPELNLIPGCWLVLGMVGGRAGIGRSGVGRAGGRASGVPNHARSMVRPARVLATGYSNN